MVADPPVRDGAGVARVCRGAHAGDGKGAAGLRRTGGEERGIKLKRAKQVLAVVLLLAMGYGAVWAVAKYRATPRPSGEAYHPVSDWPTAQNNIKIGQVSGVAVDSTGDVFIFQRADKVWEGEALTLDTISASTVLVLDSQTGTLIDHWGADTFVMPHGLTIDADDNLWLTDVGLHQVFKFDRAGNLLMTLGERGVAGNDETHFNMPSDVAVAEDGSFFVSDGYGNSRIVKFSAEGNYLASWGSKGTEPGQFDVPHSIAIDSKGILYVADRGNARLQLFDDNGQFITEWKGSTIGRPWAVRISQTGNIYVVDGGDQSQFWPDRARVLKLDSEGNLLSSFGSFGDAPGQFIWPHAIAVGLDEALYVGEVSTGMRVQKFTR